MNVFIPYWISCLDESMSVWMNELTRPCFVFFPNKPHPKGNDYHNICLGESGIMYVWDIVEVRDNLIPMGQPEFEISTNIKMVGIMLRIARALWINGKAVITDSGFCVLKLLLEMMKRGVYGGELIKKRRYCPMGVHEDVINNQFR